MSERTSLGDIELKREQASERVRERERDRERASERARERERASECVCVFLSVFVYACVRFRLPRVCKKTSHYIA